MTTVTARSYSQLQFNFVDNNSAGLLVSDISSTASLAEFTYGSGVGQINAAVQGSGSISAGGTNTLDMTSISKTFLGYSTTVTFSGVKALTIANLATESGRDIRITATGTGAFTNLFNGSGNMLIKPSGSYIYTDPWKTPVSSGQKYIQLHDVYGSGVNYSYTILGNS